MASYLATRPRGAYTCIRGDAFGNVSELPLHVDRIVTGCRTLFSPTASQLDEVRDKIDGMLRGRKIEQNVMLVVLVYFEKDKLIIEEKKFPIALKRTVLTCVLVGGGGPRRNPNTKDSQWVLDRKPLEDLKTITKSDEIILVDDVNDNDDIALLEGMVTNFFVILKDARTIMTAPEECILGGTMRSFVIRAAKSIGMNVLEHAPKWSDRTTWGSAFVTNVSKPCCFIKQLKLYSPNSKSDGEVVDLMTESPSILELCRAIDEELENNLDPK